MTRKRDFYAGGLMILFGLAATTVARTSTVGTLAHMGPGFFPLFLGVMLTCIGVAIAAGSATSRPHDDERAPPERQWRAWILVILGPALFILFGEFGGLIPATFACVFVSALGDRATSYRQALVLALGVTFFGILLFAYVLQVPFPLLRWRPL